MDIESKYAIKMLETMASDHIKLREYARRLRSRPEVSAATDTFQSSIGRTLEWYVEAELHNGKVISWGIEATWSDVAWHIETMISVNDDQGQYTLKEFPDRETETLDGFLESLEQAITDLLQSEEIITTVTNLR